MSSNDLFIKLRKKYSFAYKSVSETRLLETLISQKAPFSPATDNKWPPKS